MAGLHLWMCVSYYPMVILITVVITVPCTEGEGDCDGDSECASGFDMCPGTWEPTMAGPPLTDVCDDTSGCGG